MCYMEEDLFIVKSWRFCFNVEFALEICISI